MSESATDKNIQQLKKLIDSGMTWDADREAIQRSEVNKWRFIALVFSGLALLAFIAIASLAPLKTVEVQLLEHDTSTGRTEYMTKVSASEVKSLTEKESVILYDIKKYVRAREGYSFHNYGTNYRLVASMSSDELYKAYDKAMDSANSNSLYAIYGDSLTVRINVLSMNPLSDDSNTYVVRFRKVIDWKDPGVKDQEEIWVGTYTYDYVDREMPIEERNVNPLGFIAIAREVAKEAG